MSSRDNLDDLAGVLLDQKYLLRSLLGSGGMGTIYEAEQLGLGRSVAIKILRPELVESRMDWFRAEAMASSRINHPHAVAIYDFGATSEGLPYLVMERIRGRTLGELLEDGPMDPIRAARIAAQCLSALDEAHACGVVHCDLTAENVIVETLRDGDDFSKVIDFGLARLAEHGDRERQLVGTAEYVSPEQIRGDVISPKTDIYAMGILLYEMVIGRTPFAGASEPTILQGHLHAMPESPHYIVPAVPESMSELIVEALCKDPAGRPASAASMRARLLASIPESSSPTVSGGARRRRPTPTIRSDFADPSKRGHTTRLSYVLGKGETALVGREAELEHLAAFCGREAGPTTLQIIGPHGIGKARVTREALRGLGAETQVYSGGADPSGLKLAWYPILSMLEQVLGIRGKPTYERLRRAIARLGLPDRDTPGLAEAFGVKGPASALELAVRRREARAAALRALLSIGRRHRSAVLVFADADRYDHPSSRLLEELCQRSPANVRIILTSEKELELGETVWEMFTLAGLPPEHARALVETLAGGAATVPDELTVQSITSGSPAAAEQLAGWLELGHGASNVPSQLVDLLSIRINRLPATARRALQAVAIHGTVAPRVLVESTLDDEENACLRDRRYWTGLLVVELETLTIPSDLVASVVLACTPADVRRRLHKLALRAFGDTGPAGIRAHHAEEAGDIDTAYDLYIEAGNDRVRHFDDPGAAVCYGQAVACARRLHAKGAHGSMERLAGASVLLAEVLRLTGQYGLARGICEEAQLFGPDDHQRAMLHRTLGVIALSAEQSERAVGYLRLSIGDAMRGSDKNFLCQCYLDLVRCLDAAQRRAEGTTELVEAIDVLSLGQGLKAPNAPRRLWRLGLELAERYLLDCEIELAEMTAHTTLELAIQSENTQARGRISALFAQICEAAGKHGDALRYRADAVDALRALGDRRSTAELLIEGARSTARADGSETQAIMSLARTLAEEVGWKEGASIEH